MQNSFASRSASLQGPGTDIRPVTPSNTVDFPAVAAALYVETGGMLSIVTVSGTTRQVAVADFSILPVGVQRVNATGTTAAGIHALVVA